MMREVVLACVLLALGVAAQQQQETVLLETKLATRTLPADVLRDFPGLCFGSTTGQFYQPGLSWELGNFCGKATCMQNATGFYEVVEDCGPPPKANDNCAAEFQQPSAFPNCCPKYRCLPGVELEFPTPEELKAEAERVKAELAKQREATAAAIDAAAAPAVAADPAAEEPAAAA